MDYAKQQLKWTRSPTFKGAEPACRGVWTSLNGFCAEEENSGRIVGGKAWNDRKWMACADVTAAEVAATVAAELARWDGDDLVLNGYDLTGEQCYQAARERNRDKANIRHERERAARQEKFHAEQCPRHTSSDAAGIPQASINAAAGITSALPQQCPSPSPVPSPSPERERDPRARPVFDPGSYGAELCAILERHFLHVSERSWQEWDDLATQHARVRSTAEALRFLAWVIPTAREDGRTVEYAKHCVHLAKPANRDRWQATKPQRVPA